MRLFEQLGTDIDERWKATDFDTRAFPAIASEALEGSQAIADLDAFDVVRWVLDSDELPPQRNIESMFGEPPVQVYDHPKFVIQVLHWLDGTTAIHQHSFNGAFHVLAGSSVHSLFQFTETRRVNTAVLLGDVTLMKAEILERGATRPILHGNALIHSLFHLERPSVTVVVRTVSQANDVPQYQYIRPGIAFDSFYKPQLVRRRIQALTLFSQSGHCDYKDLLQDTLARADEFTFLQVAIASLQHMTVPDLERRIREAGRADEAFVDGVCAALHGLARESQIVRLRGHYHTPDQRFFLALLMSFRSAGEMWPLIRARYPDADPEVLVMRWLKELRGATYSTPFSDVAFDDATEDVVRLMLGGTPIDEVHNSLRREFDEADVDAHFATVLQIREALQASIFSPVFTMSA